MEANDTVAVQLTDEQAQRLKNMGITGDKAEQILADIGLRQELQAHCLKIAEQLKAGEEISWDEFHRQLNEIAQKNYGIEYGLPMPSHFEMDRPLIVAKRAPFGAVPVGGRTQYEDELAMAFIGIDDADFYIAQSRPGIADADLGPYSIQKPYAGTRLRSLFDTARIRSGAMTAARELKAVEALKKRVKESQYDSYVLNGLFLERSKRSDVVYIFRKGLPTIVLSHHGYPDGRVIACLCLHPLGYYFATHAGLMCPTDEVICALLLMRADEHEYWKKCGQWAASDPRGGL